AFSYFIFFQCVVGFHNHFTFRNLSTASTAHSSFTSIRQIRAMLQRRIQNTVAIIGKLHFKRNAVKFYGYLAGFACICFMFSYPIIMRRLGLVWRGEKFDMYFFGSYAEVLQLLTCGEQHFFRTANEKLIY